MHKNPFVPPPSYPHQQPPLPPGPPQPSAQPDYSGYWQQQGAQHQPGQPPYNPQWQNAGASWNGMQTSQPATPVKPSVEQQALYANYGYGGAGQQNLHWQQQRNQQPHYAQPPAPAAQPSMPPPPMAAQAQYNPYQPQAGAAYTQPYVPQPVAIPTQPPAASPYIPTQPGHQAFFTNQQRPPPSQHASPQQPPPAKRQRFDNSHQQTPPQPRFQPPPPPPMSHHGGQHNQNRPPGPGMSSQGSGSGQSGGNFGGGANRGGLGGRGGPPMGRGGRGGGSMHNPRGMGMHRGGARTGGSMYNSGGRSGGGGGGQGGNLRNQASRDRGSFNSNFNRRGGGGGSFGGQHHQQSHGSFRQGGGHGRSGPTGFNHGRSGRHDHYPNRGPMSSSSSSNMPRKEENRRTLTDFKIIGLQIEDLDWSWGKIVVHEEKPTQVDPTVDGDEHKVVKQEDADPEPVVKAEAEDEKAEPTLKQEPTLVVSENSTSTPTARLRIYFHTPPNADDEKPIFATHSSEVRKGKRKKLDDDDAELETGSRPRPPPVPEGPLSHINGHERQSSVAASMDRDALGRESVAPSVTETASEADWLMAAMTEGDADADADADADGELDESYDMTQIDHDMDADGEYDMDDGLLETSYQHTELVVTESVGTSGAEKGAPLVPDVSSATTTDGNDNQTSKDEVEPLVITTISSDEKQADVDGGGGGNSQGMPSSIAEMEKQSSFADEASAVAPVAASESGGVAAHTKSETSVSKENSGIDDASATEGQGPPGEQEHLPEPPASPVSNTVASSTSTGTSNVEGVSVPPPPTKAPSANRLSISYASGTRRLLIDADIVEKMTIMRSEGRIEVAMSVERLADGFKGILIEVLNDETNTYSSLTSLSEASGSDDTLPPFWTCSSPSKVVMRVYLDKERPLTEPKWVKTGDVQEWLKEQFGGRFWVAGDAVGWEKRIEVTNPEPAQTILNVMESWAANSNVGMAGERQRFLKNHMTRPDNVLEILLRLVRGERATPFTQGSAQISPPSVTGPLLSAMEPTSYHAAQQTHVSLAVVAFVRLAEETADLAFGEGKGKAEIEERVGDIIRSLPNHLVFKSLDGMMKEWRSDKKHARP